MSFRLNYRRYSLTFSRTVRTAHGFWQLREGVLVRIEGGDGKLGFGEAAPIPWFGTETVDEVVEYLDSLGGLFRPEFAEEAKLRHPCAVCALRAATEDLQESPSSGSPRAALQVAALLPAGRAALAAVGPLAEQGFRVFKWKVGVGDPGDEQAMLGDLLGSLPSGSKLRLDANGAWDARIAARWLDRCAGLPIEYVEQPVAPGSRASQDTLLGLAADYPTDLALDESLVRDADFDHWLGLGWRGVYVVKPLLLADAAGRLRELETRGAKVVFSSALETAIGACQILRLAFSWNGSRRALGLGVWPLFQNSLFDGPALAPFLREEELQSINPERLWNALS